MASRTMKKGGHAKGGKTHMQVYNAQGSHEVGEAMDEKPDFKKGGNAKKGGKVHGMKAEMRADKKPRHKRAAGGRTPYSSGHSMGKEASSTAGEGHEGNRPEPD